MRNFVTRICIECNKNKPFFAGRYINGSWLCFSCFPPSEEEINYRTIREKPRSV